MNVNRPQERAEPLRYRAVSSEPRSATSEPFPLVERAFVEVAVNSGQPARHPSRAWATGSALHPSPYGSQCGAR